MKWVYSIFLLWVIVIIVAIRFLDRSPKQLHKENLGIVTVYRYTNVKDMCDGNPNVTANNSKVYEGGCAISRDLLSDLMFGDTVLIGTNTYIVNDVMNIRHKRSVDIFTFSRSKKVLNKHYKTRLWLVY